jgi:2-polyprenyl-3-methyl-5-hydroxy-6-metoxy-1,4-benzoquinol methylase
MIFGKKYFTSGNYEDYLQRLPKYTRLSKDFCFLKRMQVNKVLDFGCGVGFLTLGLSQQGFDCVGYDKSRWAVNYANENLGIKVTYDKSVLKERYDCVFLLDVLEHNSLRKIKKIISLDTNFLIVRIPVKKEKEKSYYLSKSRNDKSHITCMSKKQWINLFNKSGYVELTRIKKTKIWDSTGVYCALLQKNDSSYTKNQAYNSKD